MQVYETFRSNYLKDVSIIYHWALQNDGGPYSAVNLINLYNMNQRICNSRYCLVPVKGRDEIVLVAPKVLLLVPCEGCRIVEMM